MRQFENQVQLVKYEVLKEVARLTFEDTIEEKYIRIPMTIDPGSEPRFRCCIHHERAVTKERVKMAMGGDESILNVVEVLSAACEQCPISRFKITEACRGCLAHRCQGACPVQAITVTKGQATIDESLCIECGKCQSACPYNAIVDTQRPCIKACHVKALTINAQKKAVIDDDLCIGCGACVYQCPFGAIQDKSQIVDVIRLLKRCQDSTEEKIYAVLAPAIASQFGDTPVGQIVTALKKLGFDDVIEAALGADLVTVHETLELKDHLEKHPFMTSSCCPAFVRFVETKHPQAVKHISSTVSPMIATAQLIRSVSPTAKVIFIGPCIAKKDEIKQYKAHSLIDHVLTFEELIAIIDAKKIPVESLEVSPLNNASKLGRGFAGSGGLSQAVKETAGSLVPDLSVKPILGDGLATCDKLIKMAKVNRLGGNFIEGMACRGGCIKGPVTIHHGTKDLKALEDYVVASVEDDAISALYPYDYEKIVLNKQNHP